jgi:hypothetical protein
VSIVVVREQRLELFHQLGARIFIAVVAASGSAASRRLRSAAELIERQSSCGVWNLGRRSALNGHA